MLIGFIRTGLLPVALLAASCDSSVAGDKAAEKVRASADPGIAFTTLAALDEPWAIALLPDGSALITERRGRLLLWDGSRGITEVAGAPAVDYGGQGGLGDVALAPDFAASRMIYLTWVEPGEGGTRGAVLGRARLSQGGKSALAGLSVIWRQSPKVSGQGHYSHRIAFSPDGQHLFLASGDRQKMMPAQDLSGNLGKVLRLLPDGSPAPGNPFAARGGVSAQVWSYGHRNILGLQFDRQGRLWDLEHGPRGGDELNLVEPGRNYGWPLVSNGDHYSGKTIPRHAGRSEYVAPAISWTPVIGPGDFVFYGGNAFPGWKGQAMIAGLVSGGLVRVAVEGTTAREVARISLGARTRDVTEDRDGSLLVLTDGPDRELVRLSPRPPVPEKTRP